MFLSDGPDNARSILVLAHGAGAAMDSPFMESIAQQASGRGLRVVRFEFPYMQRSREEDRKIPPDRLPILESSWMEVCEQIRESNPKLKRLVVGGKSMGGRIASLIADQVKADGLVCLGYPFHPPGKPEKTRTDHLESLETPTLILQGERDPFGSFDEVSEYDLSEQIEVSWISDGEHSFKPRKNAEVTEADNLSEAAARIKRFVKSL